ncbi:MAG: hypothetical protein HY903_08290 [Deltaproteobacteria bacterium]|nr:hypothetical protein [Deltaproteobacteria bacterium]
MGDTKIQAKEWAALFPGLAFGAEVGREQISVALEHAATTGSLSAGKG